MISWRGAHAIPLASFPQSGSMPQFCAIIVPDAHGTAFRPDHHQNRNGFCGHIPPQEKHMRNDNNTCNLLDMTHDEIERLIARLGKETYRARQIMKWIYRSGMTDFDEMTNLSKGFRDEMKQLASISLPQIEEIQESRDGTKKVLFRLEDGCFIESVLIREKNHWTQCVSTQAGCAMGCRFCLTGRYGLKRNLLPSKSSAR